MTRVLSRTCPVCFTMVDPVWYGWHISKCASNNSQDMAPSSTLMKNDSDKSQLVDASCRGASASLPEACTMLVPPQSQSVEEKSREENLKSSSEINEHELINLSTQKQALAEKVKDLELQLKKLECDFSAKNQAFADKVKKLELHVEELECQLRLSKESEAKALRLVESLQGCLGKGNGNISEACRRDNLLDTTIVEPKTLSSVKQFTEFKNDGISAHDNQGKEGDDQNKRSNVLKNFAAETILAKNDNCEGIELGSLVHLACEGEPVTEDFLSQVDGFIESHKAYSSTSKTSSMRDILVDPLLNAKNGDPHHDIPAMMDSHIGSFPRVIVDEEHHTTPKDALQTSFNLSNEGSRNKYEADGQEVANRNGGSIIQTKGCESCLEVQGAQVLDNDKSFEGVPQVVSEQKVHAKEAHSVSSSFSSELETHGVKPKAGLRRFVLNDSESDDNEMQANCEGGNAQNTKFFSECSGRGTCKEITVEKRTSQRFLRGSEQLKVVPSSDLLDDVTCNEVIKHNSPKSVGGPNSLESNLEGSGVGDGEDREYTGARRSKRLRTLSLLKSQSKDPGIPSSKKKTRRMVAARSSSTESSDPLQLSRDFCSRKKEIGGPIEVSSASPTETCDPIEESPHKRSKGPPRVRKRLFEEVESKPAYGSNHPMDSADDDREIESDSDSLKDFIVDSEGTEDSFSSHDGQSFSESHSSRDAFCDPSLRRDIKIRHYAWELEPEMLAAFAVNPDLCLRAVCAINRRQTEDERQDKMSKYSNKRGFSSLHAKRGTRIAEFLTDGDPGGPVKKSVEELKKFDAGGLGFCEMIATIYSKQLFEIYATAEDPYFPFS
ncbi:hypothetical protein L7F22_029996 [Adiantum nelumboides]|nr:hypothetical protein [Adiantum nelumboides]